MDDKRRKAELLRQCVLEGPGVSSPAERQAAARGEGDGPLGDYVRTVRTQATDVTDGQIEALRAAGFSDERIFELTVATGAGAAFARLDKVFSLLGDAPLGRAP